MLILLLSMAMAQQPTPDACFPDCSPGYLCHKGGCIEACNPKCTDGLRCSADRICVANEPAVEAPPDTVDTGTVCVLRKASPIAIIIKWDVSDDGGASLGTLGSGRYLCQTLAAGEKVIHVKEITTDNASPPEAATRLTVPTEGVVYASYTWKGGIVVDIVGGVIEANEAQQMLRKLKPARDSEPWPE